MRNHVKPTLSTALAIALLGSAVMLSMSQAEGPYRHVRDNPFPTQSLGHPEKALIGSWPRGAAGIADDTSAERQAFDWGLECREACPKCGFRDAKVTPVVFDVPELLGPCDVTAIETIKRKLGLNFFQGSIFDGPGTPAVQLLRHDAPPELKTCDFAVGVCYGSPWTQAACSSPCKDAQAAVCDNPYSCETAHVATASVACEGATAAVAEAADEPSARSSHNVGIGLNWRQFARELEAFEDAADALRSAGSALEETARHLELSDRYAEADTLREAAQLLRIKARALKNGASRQAAFNWAPMAPVPDYGAEASYPATNADWTEPNYFQAPPKQLD